MRPLVLAILDGWGVGAPSEGNAIVKANTQNFDRLSHQYFYTTLQITGEAVGMAYDEVGNSEIGHLALSTGQIIGQELPEINSSIKNRTFYSNPTLLETFHYCKSQKSALHLIGLLSDGGIHSHINHLGILLEMAVTYKVPKIYVHVITDGVDVQDKTASRYLTEIDGVLKMLKQGDIATIAGRNFAMDRDSNWKKTQKYYDVLANRSYNIFNISWEKVLKENYDKGISDEYIDPTCILPSYPGISQFDGIIFFNYRPDRARQITRAFVDKDFHYFERGKDLSNIYFTSMTRYGSDLATHPAFPQKPISPSLPEMLSKFNHRQLFITESMKSSCLHYFFNGRNEKPFSGQDFLVIDSMKVHNNSEAPRMKIDALTEKIISVLEKETFNFIVVNYGNVDTCAHTGEFYATVKAVQALDENIGKLSNEVLKKDGTFIVTSDHGIAEDMIDQKTQTPKKKHTTSPVPFLIANAKLLDTSNPIKKKEYIHGLYRESPSNMACDVAPTVLSFFHIPSPKEMVGRNVLNFLAHSS